MSSRDILLRSKHKLGKQLIAAKRFEEARYVYRQICARQKNDTVSWLKLGTLNGILKKHEEAVACFSKAVDLKPDHANSWYNLGIALRSTGATEKASEAFYKSLSLNPQHTEAVTSLGHVLLALHRYEEAEEIFRRVLKYQQSNMEFYAVYGSAMQTIGRHEAAIKAYRQAIDMQHPETARLYENMAASFCLQGKYQESINAFDTALQLEPDNARIHSGLLLSLHYLVDQDNNILYEQHQRWPGNRVSNASTFPQNPETRPDRLRIGYVSSDLRKHSVAYFVEPLLANHNANRFEITCYFSHTDSDSITKRLQQMAHRWRNVANLNDQQLLEQISEDKIDILVDLNGHTSGNRLSVFTQRAAPVQVSYIGYPGTTGVKEMDFRISDATADPDGAERFHTETLIRVPGCFLSYQPQETEPDIPTPPCKKNGFITFGSFNNLAKVNCEVISVWTHLLNSVPGSRLILKNPSLADQVTRDRYLEMFTDARISGDRIRLIGYIQDDANHLATYNQLDIALDTFPYNGTTTTCEALWMGVPVITLSGNRHSARVGASLLSAVGRPDWIAESPKKYIKLAQTLALKPNKLVQIRSELREQMRQSPLCSVNSHTKSIEAAYDQMISYPSQLS